MDTLAATSQANAQFQQDVLARLTEIAVRREETARSTRRGNEFEAALVAYLQQQSRARGDIAEGTGSKPGLIKHKKTGDAVIQLGSEHYAAGAKIVVEAKDDASYTLPRALEEIEVARKNRGAQVGLFVFSPDCAPDGLEGLGRYGIDIVVTWNAEDPNTDVFLLAGLELARALCVRVQRPTGAPEVDLDAFRSSVLEVERQTRGLEEISRLAGTIGNNSDRILTRVRTMRATLRKEVESLGDRIAELGRSPLPDAGLGLPHRVDASQASDPAEPQNPVESRPMHTLTRGDSTTC